MFAGATLASFVGLLPIPAQAAVHRQPSPAVGVADERVVVLADEVHDARAVGQREVVVAGLTWATTSEPLHRVVEWLGLRR